MSIFDQIGKRFSGRFPAAAVALAFFAGIFAPGVWVADACAIPDDVAPVREKVEWLCAGPTRMVGSPWHDRVSDELLERMRTLESASPHVSVFTQEFSVVVPRTKRAVLDISAGPFQGEQPVYPVWPANVRLTTTPEEGIEGRLVYIREGRIPEIPARSLKGQIAVLDVTGAANWQTAFNFGARALLILGTGDEEVRHTQGLLCRLPIELPRFYIPAGPLADALRKGEIERGRLFASANWEAAKARNVYALVRPEGWQGDGRGALTVMAPYDSTSVVPDYCKGADVAVDAATALEMLEELAQRPPVRPVLVALVDAYGTNQQGVIEMLATLATPRDDFNRQYENDEDLLLDYTAHDDLARKLEADPKGLGHLHFRGPRRIGRTILPILMGAVLVWSVLFLKGKRRVAIAVTSGALGIGLAIFAMVAGEADQGYRPLHRYVKDEIAREVVSIETIMHPMRLKMHDATGEEKKRLAKRIDDLEERRRRFNVAQRQLITKSEIRDEFRDVCELVWQRTRSRIQGQLAEVRKRMETKSVRAQLRQQIEEAVGLQIDPEDKKAPTAIEFLFGLDLSDQGAAAGPMLQGRLYRQNEVRSMEAFRRWVLGVDNDDARRQEVWPGDLRKAVDLWPLMNPEDAECHTAGDLASLTAAAQSFGTAGVSWVTLNSHRWRMDTARDVPELLDWDILAPQVQATLTMLRALADDPEFKVTTPIVPRLTQVQGLIVDQSPGEPVPRVPMNDYLTSLEPGRTPKNGQAAMYYRIEVAGVRQDNLTFTGIDGRFSFDFLPAHVGWHRRFVYIQSYKISPDRGQILRAVDLRKVGKGVRVDASLHAARQDSNLRAVVFTCEPISGMQYFDPRFLLHLPAGSLLDVRRWGLPQRLNYTLFSGMMCAFVEPGIRWQLILRAGVTRNRLAIVNVMKPDEARGLSVRESIRGFRAGEDPPGHPFHVSALDFYRLDERRVASYRRAGISSKAIDYLREKTGAQLEESEALRRQDDGAGFYRAVSAALANEVRAYHAIRDTANDVIRGAIFLLLVLVPFSFVMERLVYATPHVYRQILATMGIFGFMMIVLWSFHPAFRISAQPLIILMAFGIIFMSLLVMGMVYSRFETSLDEMQSGRAEASAARTSRWGVATTAFRLGIANMRKRILRTMLTGITVVLVTFALLCFTSTSSYVGQKEFSLDKQPGFSGVLVRQPLSRSMPGEALAYMENVIGTSWHPRYQDEMQAGEKIRPLAPRMWWTNAWNPNWRLHVRHVESGKQISVNAALGLSPYESQLTRVDRILTDWDRFVDGDGCYMPTAMAEELGIEPGQSVLVGGRSYELIATFEPTDFDEKIRDVDGQSILPTDYSNLGDDERRLVARSGAIDVMAAEMESGAGLGGEQDLPHLSSSQVLILPVEFMMGQRDCILSSIAIGADSPQDARQLAVSLIERLAFPIYYSSEKGAQVIATTPLIPRPPKSMAIPLLIAGLIIFNTMLSSIAERKREVHIYTSLGLAPLHVGFLFLAEAVTYGLIGSIAGYVLGQGVATVFAKLGLMGGLTLNYSGTQTVAVMLMVIGVVVVSSLVPAYLAGKLAAPSNERSWRVPDPKDDKIHDQLPFTATHQTAGGVMAFMLDYFDAHREGSIGSFSTDDLETCRVQADGREMLGVKGTIWLEPYDLGVRQQVHIYPKPTDVEDIYSIELELERGSGQVNSWWKLNRVFIADLRKQLLGWRKLETKHALGYIGEGKRLLRESTETQGA